MGACDLIPLPLVSPRPAGTPCRGFAFIIFDVRGLVVASAAAVENQNHEAAADDHGKEDAEAHHQLAPCWHGHIVRRDPSVMADINRPSKQGEQNTDYDEPHRDIPREGGLAASAGTFGCGEISTLARRSPAVHPNGACLLSGRRRTSS